MKRLINQEVFDYDKQKSFLKQTIYRRIFCICLFFLILQQTITVAQCISVPALPACNPPGSIVLVDGATANAGETHTFSGTSTYNNFTLNGGTLIVCGNLTLNALTVNSGTIYIQPGAVLTIFNGGAAVQLGANSNIYNYGSIVWRVSLVTGPNNIIMNCLPTSSFTIPFDQLVIQGPNTFFINNGSFQSSVFIVQSTNAPDCVCLGNGSTIVTSTIINQFTNAFIVPTGAACLNVTQNVINSNQVTNTPALYVCIPSTINVIQGPNWGNATVSAGCPSCSVALPVELLSFKGSSEGKRNILTWSTATEVNNCIFVLERSTDCVDFNSIQEITGAIHSNTLLNYAFTDSNIEPGIGYYYRLKQQDCNGEYHYSNIISLTASGYLDEEWEVWPNPTDGQIYIYHPHPVHFKMILYNSSGQVVKSNVTDKYMDVSDIPCGVYYLELINENNPPVIRKLIKN